jgi:hypothetical protein
MAGELGAVSLSGIRSVENAIGSNFDDTITGSSDANELSGKSGTDTLDGGAGSDTLDGGTGADAMSGGADNDIYVVDNAGDQALEDSGGGSDAVVTFLKTYKLGANLENLTAANVDPKAPAAFHLTGNELGNRITSFYGKDTLVGGAGNDLLDSDGQLSGRFFGNIPGASLLGDPDPKEEDGTDDVLEGGADDDLLVGGGGSDTYVFGDGWGDDIVFGFAVDEDRLVMRGVTGLKSFADLIISQDTQGTRVAFGEDSVLLAGVDPETISAEDVLFDTDGAVAGIAPEAAILVPGDVATEETAGPAILADPPAAESGDEAAAEAAVPAESSEAEMTSQAPADAADADLDQSEAASAGGEIVASPGEVLTEKTPPEDNLKAAPAGESLPIEHEGNIAGAIMGLAERAEDLGVLTGTIDFTRLQDLSSLVSDALGVAYEIAEALDLDFDVTKAANSKDFGSVETYVSAAVNVLSSLGPDFQESFSPEALREHFL